MRFIREAVKGAPELMSPGLIDLHKRFLGGIYPRGLLNGLRKSASKQIYSSADQNTFFIYGFYCAAGTGARYKITPIVFQVCTRDQACFRLFLCV